VTSTSERLIETRGDWRETEQQRGWETSSIVISTIHGTSLHSFSVVQYVLTMGQQSEKSIQSACLAPIPCIYLTSPLYFPYLNLSYEGGAQSWLPAKECSCVIGYNVIQYYLRFEVPAALCYLPCLKTYQSLFL
jgi:hypothetical protein